MHSATPGRALGLLAATLGALLCCASPAAQTIDPFPAAASAPTLPPPPHVATPDAALYPDYYALAMTHAHVVDDPNWRPLHLELGAGRAEPALIVLPVQTQAYGFPAVWRALVGARLDQELQRRHVDASRQTDIVDWRGPFVRRADDATVATLAAEHPGAGLLALYIGHDAAHHAFVSLSRTEHGQTRIAHRRLDLSDDVRDTSERVSSALPALLSELGLGDAKPAPALPAGAAEGCDASDWALNEPAREATPIATACHALLMGLLLPDYQATLWQSGPVDTPDRLAWLAQAWVEASALAAAGSRPMGSVAALAWRELRLDPPAAEPLQSLAENADVVVRPLARMLWARERAARAPQSSRDATTDSYVDGAIAGLPDFAAAVVREHAEFNEGFRIVDLCPMQVALPHFAVPRGCNDDASASARPTRASVGQRQLLDAWRVAAVWNELYVEGYLRSSAKNLERAEQSIPARLVEHPLLREMRFAMRGTLVAPDDLDSHLTRARDEVIDELQAIATLQRTDGLAAQHLLPGAGLLPAELHDAAISQAADDFRRLLAVESLGTFNRAAWDHDPAGPQRAAFLADGSYALAEMTARGNHFLIRMPAGAPSPQVVPRPTLASARSGPPIDRTTLEQELAANPFDFEARKDLAISVLKHGEGVAAARRVLDARPQRRRVEEGLDETADLETVGDVFYFTGELAAARDYYERTARFELGSGSEMYASKRLAAIDGDLHGAMDQARNAADRYRDEWMRADLAGYDFMLGRTDAAWALLLPKMQTATTAGFWRSALAGHRMARTPLAALPDWITRNHLAMASADGSSFAGGGWLRMAATLDRLPSAADIELLHSYAFDGKHQAPMTGALVIKLAIEGARPGDVDALATDLQSTWGSVRSLYMPFYAWGLWNASGGRDPALDEFRASPLDSDFASVLGKAMVLAADGRHDEAMRFVVASRYELARLSMTSYQTDFRTAPYQFVLATWLMSRKTGVQAYAQQGLAVARGYQRVTEFIGWPYAAEALLGQDPKARAVAACRAQWLDPGSMFLHESGLHPDPKSAVCRKATAWQ
jgi:hypothetical protein